MNLNTTLPRIRGTVLGVLGLLFLSEAGAPLVAQAPNSVAPDYPAGQASAIIRQLIQTPGYAGRYKQGLFSDVKRSSVRKLAATATNKTDQSLFLMLYDTRAIVPDNLTDDGLTAIVDNTKSFKKRAMQPCKRATAHQIRTLEGFPPQEVAALYEAVSAPFFSVGTKPSGASSTTWASESLWHGCQAAGKAELVRKSVILKLLADQQVIHVPESMNIVFAWSHSPTITITLDPISWTKSDIPKLKKLLSNPYYGEAAQRQITLLSRH